MSVERTEARRRLRLHDGTELAYDVAGDGPAMVLTNGLTTTANFWNQLHPRWLRQHRVLSWDMPGHGDSSPARCAVSARIEQQAEHVVRLMDAAQMETAVQVGWSTGCQVALETYRRHPSRCRALVLLLGSAGRVLSTTQLGVPGPIIHSLVGVTPAPVFSALVWTFSRVSRGAGGERVARALGLVGPATLAQDLGPIVDHLRQLDARTVQQMIGSAQEHDAWDLLPAIEVPVLIVAGERDPFAPAQTVGAVMHARCPQSELVRLARGTHTALLDHAAEIGDAVDGFLRRRVES